MEDAQASRAELLAELRDARQRLADLEQRLGAAPEGDSRSPIEQALRDSEAHFRRAIRDAPIPIMINAEDGELLQLSRIWTELSGYGPEDIPCVEDWTERAYGDRRGILRPVIDRLYERGRRLELGEVSVRTASGEERIWDFYCAPLGRLPDGRRVVMSVATDVTQRRRDETTLERNREILQLFIEHNPSAVAMFDRELRYLIASRRWLQLFGLEGHDVIGENHLSLVPDLHPEWKEIRERALQGSIERQRESSLRLGDGRVVWYSHEIRPWYERGGEIGGITMSCELITKRKTAEAALRASEERYRALAEHAYDLVSEIDERGRILFASPNYQDVLGYPPDKLVGTLPLELIDEADRARVASGSLGLVEEGASRQLPPLRFRHAEGTHRWLEVTAKSFRTASGDLHAVMIGRDVTERIRAEEALATYRDHLEELVQQRSKELEASRQRLAHTERMAAVGTLAAGIAHQINNPVSSIMAAAQYALMCEGEAQQSRVWKEALTLSADEARRCGRIVRGILQFSRGEPTEKWVEDLGDTVRRACSITQSYARQWSARITEDLCSEPCPVRMNPVAMEQVVVNLIRNAIESGPSGVHVGVLMRRRGDSVIVAVSDDGRGLDEADRARIFDPFFTTRLTEGGTGLGLSVVHRIVVDHGGTVAVDSKRGEGTTVAIELRSSEA